MSLRKCPKCECMDKFDDGKCSVCGFELEDSEKIVQAIDSPETWMYVASVVCPLLQYMFVTVYFLKGKRTDAFNMFAIPILIQMIIAIIVAVVYCLLAKETGSIK